MAAASTAVDLGRFTSSRHDDLLHKTTSASSLLSSHDDDEPEEEQTVLTSPLSLSSLSPDNPQYMQLSQEEEESGEDDHDSIPTMDHSSSHRSSNVVPFLGGSSNDDKSSFLMPTTSSSLSRDNDENDQKDMVTRTDNNAKAPHSILLSKHHDRKPSIITDLPPPGFFQSTTSSTSTFSLEKTTSPTTAYSFQQQQERDYNHTSTFVVTRVLQACTMRCDSYLSKDDDRRTWGATWIGFWALLFVTCANYMLTPMRDAIALQVGVKHMPALTLASTGLAVVSSVPIGWLFEAPDPKRRKLWRRMGLTRGETQGTSLALFYRFFAVSLLLYAVGFELNARTWSTTTSNNNDDYEATSALGWLILKISVILANFTSLGQLMYVAFFLVVHLMKLHSLSLVWGVTTEAMEYEESARIRRGGAMGKSKTRLQRLGFVGFGGTLGGILGSIIASTSHLLRMSGLLVISCVLLELSAQLSIELGRIMQIHWEEEKRHPSTNDLTNLCDSSMRRSHSMDSMKRVASGNSLNMMRSKSMQRMDAIQQSSSSQQQNNNGMTIEEQMNDNSFGQRLLRGITTILRSRLLMAIFTYNALFASTSVLLSFQRAELVVNRNNNTGSATDDTAFLAKINMASSVAVFCLQASGMGPWIAHTCGQRGTLALIPVLRLGGVTALAWWHMTSNGQPPNLLCFLLLDECTKVINFAVAKPVRESLWRGLSNEARYEAKPIVDTLANRWGGGSAAFLVSLMDTAIVTISGTSEGGLLFGISPNMLLCLGVAVWWAAVSADLGHVRRRIDLELLKKNQ